MFFTKITEIFDKQKKEIDFKKVNGHYKDKTFTFDKDDQNPKTNCFLSYNDDKNFELIGVNSPTGNYPKYYHLWFCGEKQEFIDRVLECFDKKQFGRIADTEKFNKLREETELYNNRFCYIYLNGERYTVYTINFMNYKTPEFMKMFYNKLDKYTIHFIGIIILILFFNRCNIYSFFAYQIIQEFLK